MPEPRYVAYLRLDEIKLAPRNPKGHDGPGIQNMIKLHGFAELPCLDDRTGRLVAGHGRREQLLALRAAGSPPPDGVQVAADGAWMMPVVRGWRSETDEQAEAYLLGSNRVSANGGWADDAVLATMLEELSEAHLLTFTGFTADDLDDLWAALEEQPPAAPPPPAAGGGGGGDPEPRALGDLENQTRRTKGLGALADEYSTSSVRVLVLTFSGARYVWIVAKLTELMAKRSLESNTAAVISLVEEATGEPAPASDSEVTPPETTPDE